MRIVVLVSVLLLATACSKADITGIFQTSSAAFDRMSCEARTATTSPPFFMVREGEIFGVTLNTIRACTANDAASCDRSELPDTFSQAPLTFGSSDGWEGQADSSAGFDGSKCLFGRVEVSAVLAEDGTLTVVAHARRGERAVSICDTDNVPDDLPCEEAQSVTGTRVGDAPPATGGLQL